MKVLKGNFVRLEVGMKKELSGGSLPGALGARVSWFHHIPGQPLDTRTQPVISFFSSRAVKPSSQRGWAPVKTQCLSHSGTALGLAPWKVGCLLFK